MKGVVINKLTADKLQEEREKEEEEDAEDE